MGMEVRVLQGLPSLLSRFGAVDIGKGMYLTWFSLVWLLIIVNTEAGVIINRKGRGYSAATT